MLRGCCIMLEANSRNSKGYWILFFLLKFLALWLVIIFSPNTETKIGEMKNYVLHYIH